jgi:excisionase family DNA binding protein
MTAISFETMPNAVTQLLIEVGNIKQLLIERAIPEKPKTDRILNIEEAAKFLNLSVPTMYGLVSRNELSNCKKGKRLYFLEEDLVLFIKTGRRKTQTELREEAQNYIVHKKKRA